MTHSYEMGKVQTGPFTLLVKAFGAVKKDTFPPNWCCSSDHVDLLAPGEL